MNNDKNTPTDSEAYYETVASQEEIYLEETEEELRVILTSGDLSPSQNISSMAEICRERQLDWKPERSMNDQDKDPRLGESLDEQLNHAAEELISGDSDDPPLSKEVVVEMVNNARAQRPG
jgi:hypothetical protein